MALLGLIKSLHQEKKEKKYDDQKLELLEDWKKENTDGTNKNEWEIPLCRKEMSHLEN